MLADYCKDFFVRVMASNINSAFDSLDKKLTSQTIKDSLKMATVITDFDVVQDVPDSETPGLLKNIALGKFILVRTAEFLLTVYQDPPQFQQSWVPHLAELFLQESSPLSAPLLV